MRMILALLFCVALCAGCDEKRVYDQSLSLEKAIWPAKEALHFEFDMEDTVALHNLYINLRNGEEYPYSNLFLFVELEFPNGKKSVDTLECPLADESGHWYGSGLGSVYDQRILYRSRVQFPIRGHYRVNILQAMREEELQGIHDVGFRIARAY